MADVSSNFYSWSTTASSNSPSGTTNVGSGLDDNLREIQAVVRAGLAHYNSSPVASAGTVDLGAQTGNFLIISGTTTITSFGTVSAGIWKVVRFSGALTLTYNATSLILPGAANITTVAGDVAGFVSEGSGNWRCFLYQRNAVPVDDINALTAETTIATGDAFPVYDASATANRKFTVQTVYNGVNSLSTETTVDPANDYLPMYDASGGTTDKVTPSSIVTGAAASQATMETGSSTSTIVTPGRQQYHPSAAKAWALFNTAGSVTAGYNVSSVTDNGTGSWTVNFTTAFSGTAYSVVVNPVSTAGSYVTGWINPGVSSVDVWCVNGSTGNAQDPSSGMSVVVYGDQ